MLSLITDKMYMIIIGVLLVGMIAMGIKLALMDATIEDLEDEKTEMITDIRQLHSSLALSGANETLLRVSLDAQNKQITTMQIDLDKAKIQYRVKEKKIYETIYTERVVLKDLNESEDCTQSKRITNEIINLW
jgi:hypothetical protein